MSTTWDPGQYLKFRHERTQPSIDLASRIVLPSPASILDVGCGPGNSTEVLHDRWPRARISGLDSSEEMIAQAKASHDWGEWVCADAAALGEGADRGTRPCAGPRVLQCRAAVDPRPRTPGSPAVRPRQTGRRARGPGAGQRRLPPAPVPAAHGGRSTVEPVHRRLGLAARVPRALLLLRTAVQARGTARGLGDDLPPRSSRTTGHWWNGTRAPG